MTWTQLAIALIVGAFAMWVAAVIVAQAIDRASARISAQQKTGGELPPQPVGKRTAARPAPRAH
jgi:hypothetical protein